jgi:hypothetical protein
MERSVMHERAKVMEAEYFLSKMLWKDAKPVPPWKRRKPQ